MKKSKPWDTNNTNKVIPDSFLNVPKKTRNNKKISAILIALAGIIFAGYMTFIVPVKVISVSMETITITPSNYEDIQVYVKRSPPINYVNLYTTKSSYSFTVTPEDFRTFFYDTEKKSLRKITLSIPVYHFVLEDGDTKNCIKTMTYGPNLFTYIGKNRTGMNIFSSENQNSYGSIGETLKLDKDPMNYVGTRFYQIKSELSCTN